MAEKSQYKQIEYDHEMGAMHLVPAQGSEVYTGLNIITKKQRIRTRRGAHAEGPALPVKGETFFPKPGSARGIA